jgi:lipoprotein NlpI
MLVPAFTLTGPVRKWNLMRTLCFILLALTFRADAPDKGESLSALLNRGNEQLRDGRPAEAVATFTRCIDLAPKRSDLFDLRGTAHFFAGKFKESVADFDRAITLDPELAPGHWRRGISLYYAGEFEKGKKQFEGYEKVDTNDVENAVWHFLCAARKDGVDSARKGILKIGKDRRPVMMTVYDLFRGTAKPADVLAAAEGGELSDEGRQAARFYAHLYVGLYYEAVGDAKKAAEHLALAGGKYRIGHYMGQVARVHAELLSKK